jgi:hypothetical protein
MIFAERWPWSPRRPGRAPRVSSGTHSSPCSTMLGIPVEQIAQLADHSGSTSQRVYRHRLMPVIQTGATNMDSLFARNSGSE